MAAHSGKYDYIFIKHPHMSQVLGQVLGTTFNLQPVGLLAGNRNSSKKSEVTDSVSSIKGNAGGRMDRGIKCGQVSPATREEVTKARSQSSALSYPGSLSSNPISSLADSLASSYSVRAASLQLQC